jgi:hypothetical protein
MFNLYIVVDGEQRVYIAFSPSISTITPHSDFRYSENIRSSLDILKNFDYQKLLELYYYSWMTPYFGAHAPLTHASPNR